MASSSPIVFLQVLYTPMCSSQQRVSLFLEEFFVVLEIVSRWSLCSWFRQEGNGFQAVLLRFQRFLLSLCVKLRRWWINGGFWKGCGWVEWVGFGSKRLGFSGWKREAEKEEEGIEKRGTFVISHSSDKMRGIFVTSSHNFAKSTRHVRCLVTWQSLCKLRDEILND